MFVAMERRAFLAGLAGSALAVGLPVLGGASEADAAQLPSRVGKGRRIVYSLKRQSIWVFNDKNVPVKWHRVSGKLSSPKPGQYFVYSKSQTSFATHNPNIQWNYMVRFARSPSGNAIGFHAIPRVCVKGKCSPMQGIGQLGTPLSAGCVRQSPKDAIWLYNWAQVGTKVHVIWD
jgi:hypothetical protein